MVEAIVSFRAAGGRERPSDALATLSPQDQQRIRWFYLSRVAVYDNNYYQYQNGYLSEGRYQSIDAPIINGDIPLWDAFGFFHTPEFQEEINRLRDQ